MKKPKIGLEIHGYLLTKEKLFCRCKAEHGLKKASPNTNICPICTGYPGSKPMLPNKEAIKKIIQIALMLNCKINKKFIWQRKHYDWPDLPKGYQNTISGTHAIPVGEKGEFLGIKIREVHLEEDPASWNPETGCVDYNRSGSPLVEIVTEPDFHTKEEVSLWLKQLVLTFSYIKALDKESGIKADVNISIYGDRAEIKNVNSISSIVRTIEYEVKRQEKEKPINRETRAWNDIKGKTEKMREKESGEDYRFISEPDLPVVNIDEKEIHELKKNLPESPSKKLEKLIKRHKIPEKDAEVLTSNLELVEFFEEISQKISPSFALPWITIELLRVLNYNKKILGEVEIKPEHFSELLKAVQKQKITKLKAKQILNDFIPKSFSIKNKIKSEATIDSSEEIESIVEKVIKKNKKAVEDFKSGEKSALNFLIGQIMKESNRRADFKTSKEILEKKLK